MNKSIFIILLAPVLVAVGYIVILRHLGIAPGYFRLVMATAGFVAAIWFIRRKATKSAKSAGQ